MALLLRSFGALGGKDEPSAAQAFKLTHLSDPHHVLILRSALVDHVAQDGVLGPMFHCTSGFRGVARRDASTWPGYGLRVVSTEDAQRTQQKRRMTELFQCSSRPMLYMSSEECDFECPGGLWRPGKIRFLFRCWRATEDGRSCGRPDIDGL